MNNTYTYAKKQITGLYNIKLAMEKAIKEGNFGFFDGLKINKKSQATYCQEYLEMHEEDLTPSQHEELSTLLKSVLGLFDNIIDPRNFMN